MFTGQFPCWFHFLPTDGAIVRILRQLFRRRHRITNKQFTVVTIIRFISISLTFAPDDFAPTNSFDVSYIVVVSLETDIATAYRSPNSPSTRKYYSTITCANDARNQLLTLPIRISIRYNMRQRYVSPTFYSNRLLLWLLLLLRHHLYSPVAYRTNGTRNG